jgi:hypothetical protein
VTVFFAKIGDVRAEGEGFLSCAGRQWNAVALLARQSRM